MHFIHANIAKVECNNVYKLGGRMRHCIKRKEQINKDAFNIELANNLANEVYFHETNNS